MTRADHQIVLATQDDIDGILTLQDANQPDCGGVLSVRFPRDWIAAAVAREAIMVARLSRDVAGYVIAGELKAQSQVPVVQAMLRAYRPAPGAYLYGPICVAASARGQGLAGALFDALRARLPGRASITFIRRDNTISRRAHAGMGMREVAAFTHDGVEQIVVVFEP